MDLKEITALQLALPPIGELPSNEDVDCSPESPAQSRRDSIAMLCNNGVVGRRFLLPQTPEWKENDAVLGWEGFEDGRIIDDSPDSPDSPSRRQEEERRREQAIRSIYSKQEDFDKTLWTFSVRPSLLLDLNETETVGDKKKHAEKRRGFLHRLFNTRGGRGGGGGTARHPRHGSIDHHYANHDDDDEEDGEEVKRKGREKEVGSSKPKSSREANRSSRAGESHGRLEECEDSDVEVYDLRECRRLPNYLVTCNEAQGSRPPSVSVPASMSFFDLNGDFKRRRNASLTGRRRKSYSYSTMPPLAEVEGGRGDHGTFTLFEEDEIGSPRRRKASLARLGIRLSEFLPTWATPRSSRQNVERKPDGEGDSPAKNQGVRPPIPTSPLEAFCP